MAHFTLDQGNEKNMGFADALIFLVNHRGVLAENRMVEALSLPRFTQLLEGAGPTFQEVETIANILGVPISSFQITHHGPSPELEIAFAEILYESSRMSKQERTNLAQEILKLIHPDSEDAIKILQFPQEKQDS